MIEKEVCRRYSMIDKKKNLEKLFIDMHPKLDIFRLGS